MTLGRTFYGLGEYVTLGRTFYGLGEYVTLDRMFYSLLLVTGRIRDIGQNVLQSSFGNLANT